MVVDLWVADSISLLILLLKKVSGSTYLKIMTWQSIFPAWCRKTRDKSLVYSSLHSCKKYVLPKRPSLVLHWLEYVVDLCILTLLSISMKEGKSSFRIKISVWIVFIACPKYWGHGRYRLMWLQRTPLNSGKKCNKKCMYCYFRALCPID